MRNQEELNHIWAGILGGGFGNDPLTIAPQRVVTEPGLEIMTIPSSDGTRRDIYQRRQGEDWEQVENVGAILWAVIKSALENPAYKWRTIEGVSAEIGLPESIVSANVNSHVEQVVKSSIPSKDGSDLFTTRKHYREKSSIIERVQNAVMNRVQK